MNILHRIWTGIVAAVAGVALAVLFQIVGMMMLGLQLDYLKWLILACASIGFLFGVLIGPRSKKASDKQ